MRGGEEGVDEEEMVDMQAAKVRGLVGKWMVGEMGRWRCGRAITAFSFGPRSVDFSGCCPLILAPFDRSSVTSYGYFSKLIVKYDLTF